jgi:hypothetical protein
MVPVLEQLMRSPDEGGEVARYACSCAEAILRQSPQHRAASEAIIVPRVVALVKHATAIVLRASVGAATGTATGCGSNSAPAARTTITASAAGAGATPVDAAPQSREEQVEWQPPDYVISALSFLTEFRPSTDTNVVRTTLMLLASLRKLPQTSPVLAVIEVALAFLMRPARGPVEQRRVLIDGGMLNTVFDMLAHMGHGDPDAYVTACGTLYALVGAEPDGGETETGPIIDRMIAAAFASGAVNDEGVPVSLWNLANSVAGYPAEIAALVAAKASQRSQSEGGGTRLDGSAEEQSNYASTVAHTMMILMTSGLSEGSDFNNGPGSGKACANPRSWWYVLYRRLRALLKNSRAPAAVGLLRFCAAAAVITADANRGPKGRFR